MVITGYSKIVNDNDWYYFDMIRLIVSYADPDAKIHIDKLDKTIKTRIIPSNIIFRQDIIDCIIALHRIFYIKLDFSKSTKIQKNIYYSLEL